MKDVQNSQDNRNVDIQKVGIKHVELPLVVQRKNATDKVVYANARVCVSLPRDYKGTHMSRFVEVLNEWRTKKLLGVDIRGCLEEVIKRLDAQSGELEFNFKYFVNKEAPVSKLSAPMCYDCSFEGRIDNDEYKFVLGVKVPVTTLCPCSKEISNYSAHNQRALIKVLVSYDEKDQIWLEDLISEEDKIPSIYDLFSSKYFLLSLAILHNNTNNKPKNATSARSDKNTNAPSLHFSIGTLAKKVFIIFTSALV